MKDNYKSQQKLIVIIRQYISNKEIQIQYLNLIKEDNLNPFMNLIKNSIMKNLRRVMPLSFHFYCYDDKKR